MALSFPPSPAIGDIYGSWQWNGSAWGPIPGGAGSSGSVSITAGTGVTVSPSPLTGTGTVALSTPVAISAGGTNATTAGAGADNLHGFSGATAGLVRRTGSATYALDGASYLTANQTITLSGAVTGSGATSIATTLANMAPNSLRGNNTASAAAPLDLTVAQTMTLLGAAPLASPTFTGTPSLPTGTTAVTQAAAINNTSLATTAYVQSQFPLTVAKGGTGSTTISMPVLTGFTLANTLLVGNGTTALTGSPWGTWGDPSLVGIGYGTGGNPYIETFAARGTSGAPSAVQSGDTLFQVGGRGYGTSAWSSGWRYGVNVLAAETWTGTAQGTKFVWRTTPTGGIATADAMTLDGSGNLTITGGTATKPGGGSWVAPSDRSLKSTVVPWGTGLQAVLALEPISYKYNNEKWNIEPDYIGLDAEAAIAVIPEMAREVTLTPHVEHHDGETEIISLPALDFQPLLMALVGAVQELNKNNEQLIARIATLEAG